MESKNVFESHFGGLIAFGAVLVFFGAFYFDVFVRNLIWTIFFLAYAGVYFWNWKRTGRIKYVISSVAFLLAFIVGGANTFLEFLSWKVIWVSTAVIVVLSAAVGALFVEPKEKIKSVSS